MRIALFHNLSTGGGKRHLYEQARELAARGHTLELFAPRSASGEDEYLPLAPLCERVHLYGSEGTHSAAAGASAPRPASRLKERAKATPLVRDVMDALWARRTLWRMAELGREYAHMAADIDAGGFDVAYVHHCVLTLAPDVLRYLRRTPSVFCCHDTQRSAMEWPPETPEGYDSLPGTPLRRKRRGRLLSPAQVRFVERLERHFVENTRAADVVLSNSLYTREALARGAGVNARNCYPGVDTEFFRPDSAVTRENTVLSVGALLPSKRHGFVLEAVATIPADVRPRLEIVGYRGGPQAEALERGLRERAAAAGVELAIQCEVTDEALLSAYRRAGVVAFAPYLEPFGLVSVEAMACETPVVGVHEAGVRETIRDGMTGLLAGLDPVEFGRALSGLLSDPMRARRMGEDARRIAEKEWTWKRSTDRLEPILRAAAESFVRRLDRRV